MISPDPYISLGEIGIPPYFAERLSFPEHVNAHNAASLATRVKNGGMRYPGALMIEDEKSGTKVHLTQGSESRREKLSQLIGVGEGKIVHRHAQTGDVVLVNRQPTLHKPSILAHNCRVLKGERTIRLTTQIARGTMPILMEMRSISTYRRTKCPGPGLHHHASVRTSTFPRTASHQGADPRPRHQQRLPGHATPSGPFPRSCWSTKPAFCGGKGPSLPAMIKPCSAGRAGHLERPCQRPWGRQV